MKFLIKSSISLQLLYLPPLITYQTQITSNKTWIDVTDSTKISLLKVIQTTDYLSKQNKSLLTQTKSKSPTMTIFQEKN